ncbi:MAG: hypothetical protein WCT85_04700 [Parachlamydiales bacterium]|jgi:hypothetical protein
MTSPINSTPLRNMPISPISPQKSPPVSPSKVNPSSPKPKTSSISINQRDLISQIEKTPPQKQNDIQSLKLETDIRAKEFVEKASLFTTLNTLHWFGNQGEASSEDGNKLRLVLKELSQSENPGFWKISDAMKKYFPKLSTSRMFVTYYLYLWFGKLPKFYIQLTLNQILFFSRNSLREGNNLPNLGSGLLGTLNTYLANYNRTVERFRDDPNNPIGDRDEFVREELKKPEILGYKSTEKLYQEFAQAASKEDLRPAFRMLSSPIKKFQTLDFDFLKNYPKTKFLLSFFTYPLGILPYLGARIIEFFPNRIVKTAHSYIIKAFMPSVIQNTLESVSTPGFTHAINNFLCDIIGDLLTEMHKNPEEKSIEDEPNLINEALSQDIKKFSELLSVLILREPYKTQEELQYVKQNGYDPQSPVERIAKLLTAKGYIDRSCIKPISEDALEAGIKNCFNLLFAKPEKLEQYLCNLIMMLNPIFDYAPDPNSDEGKALAEEMTLKRKQRDELVDRIIEEGIIMGTEDSIKEKLNTLSRHQKEGLLVSYRKIKKKNSEALPGLSTDAKGIISSSALVDPTPAQLKEEEEKIEKAISDIKRLFISIDNELSSQAESVKREMSQKLQPFLNLETNLTNDILKIKELHERKEHLKLLSTELKLLIESLEESLKSEDMESKLSLIKKHLETIQELDPAHILEPINLEYQKILKQFDKIKNHKAFANKLEEIFQNSYFSKSPLFSLAKAQKEYLAHNHSSQSEQKLSAAKDKMQQFLKELSNISLNSKDVEELKESVDNILNCKEDSDLSKEYTISLSLFKAKLKKHRSLYAGEKTVLQNFFSKYLNLLTKHLTDFPNITGKIHQDLTKHALSLQATVEKIPTSLENVESQSSFTFPRLPITNIVGSISSFAAGYLGYLSPTASILTGGIGLAAAVISPKETFKNASSSIVVSLATSAGVPLAKSAVESSYNLMTNKPFYEGLINAYMKVFVNYVKTKK